MFFLKIFSNFSEHLFCKTLPDDCFSNSYSPPERQLFIYSGHFIVFWVFSHWLELLLNCLLLPEKNFRDGDSRDPFIFAFTEKLFLCFVDRYYWDNYR